MGQVLPQLLDALSLKYLYTHVCNVMVCESECGVCSCHCHTDEIQVSDSDNSFDAEGCCGTIHYSTDAHEETT